MIKVPPLSGIGKQTWRADTLHLSLIVVLWTAMVIFANPFGDFPLNDDWVYGLAVKSILANGYYHFPSPSSSNVGPQVYWGALFCLPFGFSFTALRMSTLVLGLGGVAALYGTIKLVCGVPKTALFGALVLAVNPLYFGLANSYMTDVPFLALLLVALYLFVRGFGNSSHRDILIGVIISLAAILVRQLGLVLLLGAAIAYPMKFGFTVKNLSKSVAVVLFAGLLHVAYQYWLVHTGRTPVLMVHSDVNHLLSISGSGWYMRKVVFSTVACIGLFLLPLGGAILLSKRARATYFGSPRFNFCWLAFVALWAGVCWWKTDAWFPSLGNTLTQFGIGPLTLRDTYFLHQNDPPVPTIVKDVWAVIGAVSTVFGAACVFYFAALTTTNFVKFLRGRPGHDAWRFWLLVGTVLPYFLILILISGSLPVFDRYFLLFVPVGVLLVCNLKPQLFPAENAFGSIAPWALIVAYATFSAVATHDYLQWNRVRWTALNDLMVHEKVTPSAIDGGYEFNGLFLYQTAYKPEAKKSWWWVDDDSYIIASGPVAGYSEIHRYGFRRWLVADNSNILVLRKNTPKLSNGAPPAAR